MEPRRIVLTNLNPSVYSRRYVSSFLTELIVNSLLYEEVLIREGDLICNRHLTTHLKDSQTFEVFCELLTVGAVKLLRLSPELISSDLRHDRDHQPLSARAEDHMVRRSYKGRPWKPQPWEWEIYGRLDPVLRNSAAYQTQKRFPRYNDFAEELKTILSERGENRLQEHRPFRDMDDAIADQFIVLCSDPDAWVRFLHDKGAKRPVIGPDSGFYRTAAYQCLQFFEKYRGMQRLIESTYAACECDREKADGRYGRSALAELPYRYGAADEHEAATETVMKLETVPVEDPMRIKVTRGVGEVMAAVRAHPEFRKLQVLLQNLADAEDPERAFSWAWRSLSSVVADQWARRMVPRERVDQLVTRIALGIYLTLRSGFVAFHGSESLDWSVLGDYAAINRIEHWAPALSRSVRALTKIPRMQRGLLRAATLRCTRVTLSHKLGIDGT